MERHPKMPDGKSCRQGSLTFAEDSGAGRTETDTHVNGSVREQPAWVLHLHSAFVRI